VENSVTSFNVRG